MKEDNILNASEPAAALLSEEFGKIKLTSKMRTAVAKAERDLEEGKCFSEADFKNRFAKWL